MAIVVPNVDEYAKALSARAERAAWRLNRRLASKQASYLERSPVIDLYAAWERAVATDLNGLWVAKAEQLKQHFADVLGVRADPTDILYQERYWEVWADDYFNRLNQHVEKGVGIGAHEAMRQLEVNFSLGVDANALNPRVTKYSRRMSMRLVQGITNTDKRNLRQELTSWTTANEDYPALVGRIDKIIKNPIRADLIASTEATRVYARGNVLAWTESGIVRGKQWKTAQDEIVCPICKGLHNQLSGLKGKGGRRWRHTRAAETVREAQRNFGEFVQNPPAHPRCRCVVAPWVKELPKYVKPAKPKFPRPKPLPRPKKPEAERVWGGQAAWDKLAAREAEMSGPSTPGLFYSTEDARDGYLASSLSKGGQTFQEAARRKFGGQWVYRPNAQLDEKMLGEAEEAVRKMKAEFMKNAKESEIESVTLYRGMSLDDVEHGEIAEILLNPVSSWTSDRKAAELFAGMHRAGKQGVVLEASIPIDRILTSGALMDTNTMRFASEWLVIGEGPIEASIKFLGGG